MRAGLTGFLLGAVLAVLALFLLARWTMAAVAKNLSYHLYTCVLDGADFPGGDLDDGRLIRRALVPVKITTTFYDAGYHEVSRAEKPGRYGAVVRLDVAGFPSYRFITLYRTPVKIFWEATPMSISAQLPAELGLNPAVVRAQQPEIGQALQTAAVDDDDVPEATAILLAGLAETPPDAPPAVRRTNVRARNAEWWEGLRGRLGLLQKYPYIVDLPKDYAAGFGKRWPLILFLASAGDRGDNVEVVRHAGLAGEIERGRQIPAIVVTPVCPLDESWRPLVLVRLLDEICAAYPVDRDRICVTGMSDGGDGAWNVGMLQPERFAALAPICGEGDWTDAARLVNVPVWTFQGLRDDLVPPVMTTGMVEAIRKAGGHPHLTLYPDAGHPETWAKAYATDALYTWMLAQRRGQPEVVTPGVPADATLPVPAPGPTADHR
jgi:pimeloyl-ACP methyl ester carboxylesterase